MQQPNPAVVPRYQIDNKDLTIIARLGEGSFGEVFSGTWKHAEVAIKEIKMNQGDQAALKELEKEVAMMVKLSYPHIITFHGASFESPYRLVMELMKLGSLYQVLHNKQYSDAFLQSKRTEIAMDIAKGLNFLHTNEPSIIHRDLKSANILLDDSFRAKISDFGLAKVTQNTASIIATNPNVAGTVAWMAPELFINIDASCTVASDIYSYGMVLWELVTREHPYKNQNNQAIIKFFVTAGQRQPVPAGTSYILTKLITECLSQEPNERPNMKQVMELLSLEQWIINLLHNAWNNLMPKSTVASSSSAQYLSNYSQVSTMAQDPSVTFNGNLVSFDNSTTSSVKISPPAKTSSSQSTLKLSVSSNAVAPNNFQADSHQDLYCMLTGKIMLEPVFTEDGATYEKEAIEQVLQSTNISPKTEKVLTSTKLISDLATTKRVVKLLEQYPKLYEQNQVYLPQYWKSGILEAIKTKQLQITKEWLAKDKRLLTCKLDDFNNTAFYLACQTDSTELTDLLLTELQVNQQIEEQLNIIKPINFKPIALNRLLEEALIMKNLTKSDLLFQLGAEIEQLNDLNNTLLHRMIMQNNLEAIKWILEKKQLYLLERHNEKGETPLFLAIINQNYELTELLLKAGSNPNVYCLNERLTPLHLAAIKGNVAIVNLLLKQDGIEIDSLSANGDTALHLAASHAQNEVIALLLQAGSNHKLRNNNNQTPAKVARTQSHITTANLISRLINDADKAKITELEKKLELLTLEKESTTFNLTAQNQLIQNLTEQLQKMSINKDELPSTTTRKYFGFFTKEMIEFLALGTVAAVSVGVLHNKLTKCINEQQIAIEQLEDELTIATNLYNTHYHEFNAAVEYKSQTSWPMFESLVASEQEIPLRLRAIEYTGSFKILKELKRLLNNEFLDAEICNSERENIFSTIQKLVKENLNYLTEEKKINILSKLTSKQKEFYLKTLTNYVENHEKVMMLRRILLDPQKSEVSKAMQVLNDNLFNASTILPFMVSQFQQILPAGILGAMSMPNFDLLIPAYNVFLMTIKCYEIKINNDILVKLTEYLNNKLQFLANLNQTDIFDLLLRQYKGIRYNIGHAIYKCKTDIASAAADGSLEKLLPNNQNTLELFKLLDELELRRLVLYRFCQLIGNPINLRHLIERLDSKITILQRNKKFYDEFDNKIIVMSSNLSVVEFEQCLYNGANVNQWDAWGQPIHHISRNSGTASAIRMLHQLFKASALLQYNEGTRRDNHDTWGINIVPIRWALNNAYFEKAILYCASGYDIIESSVHGYNLYWWANINSWNAIVTKYILKDMNLETGVLNKKELRQAYDFYRQVEAGQKPASIGINHNCLLWLVAILGDLKVIEAVENFKVDFNQIVPITNFSPLMMAVHCGQEQVVDFLLENGASIDMQFQVVDPYPYTNGDSRKTSDERLNVQSHLLFLAINNKHFTIANKLIHAGIQAPENTLKEIQEGLKSMIKVDLTDSQISHQLPDKFGITSEPNTLKELQQIIEECYFQAAEKQQVQPLISTYSNKVGVNVNSNVNSNLRLKPV